MLLLYIFLSNDFAGKVTVFACAVFPCLCGRTSVEWLIDLYG